MTQRANYFFHVQDGVFTPDNQGTELAGSDAAREHAIHSIRELISEGALEGYDRRHWTMIVTDEGGRNVHTLPFSYALRRE